MIPKKRIIEAAQAKGVFERVTGLVSAAYMLTSEANTLIEESADILNDHGLLLGDLKRLHSDFVRCADRYFNEYSKMGQDGAVMDYFTDLEQFDTDFRKWAGVPAGWKPKEMKGADK